MKLGIDMLPLKTSCNTRGIGRYSYNLFKKLIDIDKINKYYFFNVPMHMADDFMQENTVVSERKPTANDTEKLDIFFVTNLLEDRDRDTLRPTQIKCKKALIFYDLIPVIFWEKYVDSWSQKDRYEYFRRLSYIKDFDLIFAISRTSKNDLVELVGISEDKIKIIFAGIDENFLRDKCSENETSLIKAKYGIDGRFVLSTIGYDFRKNINGIFNAFCNITNDLNLVMVCSLQPEIEKQLRKNWGRLGLPQTRLTLTNYIPTEDLIPLYDSSDVFLFPSLYEGFGLPVLEAMSRGCPVITSNTSSLPEVCECAALYVNPNNPKEIADAVNKIFSDTYLKDILIKLGLEQHKKFNWKRVALEVLETLESIHDQKSVGITLQKYKIAYFTPLNPVKSGISDYSEELLPILKNSLDIDIFIDNGYSPINKGIANFFDIYSHKHFEKMNKNKKYDLCLYQMGNSKYHAYMLKYLLKYPGLMVLHDLTLSGLILYFFNKDGLFNRDKFLKCIFRNHGYIKYTKIKKILEKNKPIDNYDLSQNFAKVFLDFSILTLVHNQFSKKFLENQVSFCKIWTTKHQGIPYEFDYETKKKLKAKNNIYDEIVISAFGRITFTKRIDVLLKAFSKLVNEMNIKNVKLFLVGELQDDVRQQILGIIKKEKLEDVTTITGYVGKDEFNKYLEITDVCVNLRFPTSGETSGTLVKALSYGIPVITTNYAQYREYPDSCCWKLDLGIDEINLLSEYLFELVTNENIRKIMSRNAYDYAKITNNINETVNDYLRAINYAVQCKKNRNYSATHQNPIFFSKHHES